MKIIGWGVTALIAFAAVAVVEAEASVPATSAGLYCPKTGPMPYERRVACGFVTKWRSCGTVHWLGVVANSKTSCAFARRVARASRINTGYTRRTVRVYSSATHRWITMRGTGCGCDSFDPYGYRGGNGAAMEFRS
jgi:hypothetical protein